MSQKLDITDSVSSVHDNLGRTAEHHCTVTDGGKVNGSIPFDEETGGLQRCAIYAENSTNVTTSCDHGWTYNNVDGDYTIVNEVITVLIRTAAVFRSTFLYVLSKFLTQPAVNNAVNKIDI